MALHPPEHFTVSAHRLLGHDVTVAAVQAPAPLHTVGLVTLPLAQDPAVHVVVPPGKPHLVASVPVQVPLHGAVPLQAVRVPRGLPDTGEHVPILLGSLQLSHWPLQALLQHTPSTQFPFEHSAGAAQVAPSAFFPWQMPAAVQKLPAAHGWVALHESRHRVALAHWVLRQAIVAGATQPPLPSQVDGGVSVPPAHDEGAQVVVPAG